MISVHYVTCHVVVTMDPVSLPLVVGPLNTATGSLDSDFQYECGPRKRGLSILLLVESFKQEMILRLF